MKKKISKVLGSLSVFGSSLFLAPVAFAGWETWITGINEGEQRPLMEVLKSLLSYAIGFSAFVCVAILIYAGYSYITASGDEVKIQKATKTLTWAIVGLIICFIAVILVRFVLTDLLKAE